MSEKTKQFDHSFQVNLDSEVTTLSGRSLRSLLELFAHLESLGMRQPKGRAKDMTVVSEFEFGCGPKCRINGVPTSALL